MLLHGDCMRACAYAFVVGVVDSIIAHQQDHGQKWQPQCSRRKHQGVVAKECDGGNGGYIGG